MKSNTMQYEIDGLILSDSGNEEEIPFVLMDGIAIQIESVDNPNPVKSPIILTYPKKDEVKRNDKMHIEIEDYTGQEWEGDLYSIALKYGQVNLLKHSK